MNITGIPAVWFVVSGFFYLLGLISCAFLAPQSFSVGFAFGGALVLLNAWASARKIAGAEFAHKSRATASILMGFYARLALMGICLFLLIKFCNVDPLGLVAGLSVMPAGLFGMLVLIYIANRSPQEV